MIPAILHAPAGRAGLQSRRNLLAPLGALVPEAGLFARAPKL